MWSVQACNFNIIDHLYSGQNIQLVPEIRWSLLPLVSSTCPTIHVIRHSKYIIYTVTSYVRQLTNFPQAFIPLIATGNIIHPLLSGRPQYTPIRPSISTVGGYQIDRQWFFIQYGHKLDINWTGQRGILQYHPPSTYFL